MLGLRTHGRRVRTALVLVPALLLTLAACDSADPLPEEAQIHGTVTSTADHGTQPGPDDAVEGATVTAASVGAGGQLTALNGQVVTDAEGRFTLTADTRPEPIRLFAETEDGFRASVLLEAGALSAGGVVTAPPMNVQSTAAADVFVEAAAEYHGITAADATMHIDASTAAAIHAGALAVGPVATSLASGAEATSAFAMHADGGAATQATVDAGLEHRRSAYATLRSALATAASASARATALEAFFDAYGEAFVQAGMSPLYAAHTASAAAGAGARFTGEVTAAHSFAMTRHARMQAANRVAYAVEAEFEAAAATQQRLETLAEARAELMTSLMAATSAAQMADAVATYRSVVRAELAAHAEISTGMVDAAFQATSAARAALDTAVATATGAAAVADAYATFYGSAHAAAHGALGLEADYGANVVAAIAAL